MTKVVYAYFITPKGRERLKKTKAVPGTLRYHFRRTVRALWALDRKRISGGTAKYLRDWIEPMDTERTERALNGLVTKGFARRRKLT